MFRCCAGVGLCFDVCPLWLRVSRLRRGRVSSCRCRAGVYVDALWVCVPMLGALWVAGVCPCGVCLGGWLYIRGVFVQLASCIDTGLGLGVVLCWRVCFTWFIARQELPRRSTA